MDEDTNTTLMIYCPICFKNFNNDVKIITLNCGHYFCSNCLGHTNFQTYFKCCVCRSTNLSYDSSNANLIDLFNYVYTENINRSNNLNENFCLDCDQFIEPFYHSKQFPSHLVIKKESIKEKISEFKCEMKKIEEEYSKINYIGKMKSDFNFNQLQKYCESSIYETFKQFKTKLTEEINKDLSGNVKDNYNKTLEIAKKLFEFQKCMRNLSNPDYIEDVVNIILKSYNKLSFENLNYSHKNYVASYIMNTKKVAVFDVDSLEVEIIEISDLPFDFYRTSHSIEYVFIKKKILIVGGKQEKILRDFTSNKIWEYSIDENICREVVSLDVQITDHRSILIEETLFIIGGRQGIKDYSFDIFYDKIVTIDTSCYVVDSNSFKLNQPRSNFGLAVNNKQLFVCFGLTTGGIYLNNIEIIDMLSKVSSTYMITSYNTEKLMLSDPGIILDDSNEKLIILGGSKFNKENNSIIYYYDMKDYKYIDSSESKEIVSATFTTYGIKFNNILAILSNYTINDTLPHIYLYSDTNKKWTCHSIDIYCDQL